MWKNITDRGRVQMIIWRMRIACWVTKVTNTHSEYVILIAFPLQQWKHESSSLLRRTYKVAHCYVVRTWPVLFKIVPRCDNMSVCEGTVLRNEDNLVE